MILANTFTPTKMPTNDGLQSRTHGFNAGLQFSYYETWGNYLVSLDPVFLICKMELLIEWRSPHKSAVTI